MRGIKRLFGKEPRVLAYAVPVFLILCMFAAVLSTGLRQLAENEKRIHEGALSDLTLNAKIVSQRIGDLYVSLEAAAPLLSAQAGASQDQMIFAMTSLKTSCGFDFVVRTDTDGIAFNDQGKGNIDLGGRAYIHKALSGSRAIEYVDSGTYDPSSAYVILAVPIRDGDSVVGVLHGSYRVANFDNLLSSLTGSGQGGSDAFILASDGTEIAASDRSADVGPFAEALGTDSGEQTADNLASGASGYLKSSENGRAQYFYYTPLTGPTDSRWVMVTAVDAANVEARSRTLKIGILILCLVSVCITAALIYSVVRRQRLVVRQRQDALALSGALDDARRANHAKTEFLSRMSHDMRTPLNGIIGMTYLARKNDNPAKTADCLAKIDTSSKFLLGLINDVLDMSRAESGRMELHPEPYDIHQFISYVEAVIVPLCAEKSIHLTFDLRPIETRTPVMDPLRYNQLCFNLLSNAVKYTPEGGSVTLKIHDTMLTETRLSMELEISDTGVGMSEEFQKTMFEPFTQENRSDVSPTRGSGLGLAIAKKIIDLMGGTVEVRSAIGQGTTFSVRLEFDSVPARPESAPDKIAGDDDCLAGKHILLCEDHPLNQEIANTLLSEKGVIVVNAENGLIGVEKFSRSVPGYFSAILMDIRMPVMDGYEATRRIRALGRADAVQIPILAMTADAFEESIREAKKAGMSGYITKPIEPQILFGALREAMGCGAPTGRLF